MRGARSLVHAEAVSSRSCPFNNLLASSRWGERKGELLIVSCRLSPAVSGRLAAGGPWHEPGYLDAVAVINTGNRESIIYQHDASRVNFYSTDLIIRNTGLISVKNGGHFEL